MITILSLSTGTRRSEANEIKTKHKIRHTRYGTNGEA